MQEHGKHRASASQSSSELTSTAPRTAPLPFYDKVAPPYAVQARIIAKRSNNDPQDSATAAPALRLSSSFQESSADIELRSKDGVRFLVHKVNLGVSSSVFADLFASATSGSHERPIIIDLEEIAEVLERLLPYCYPTRVEPIKFDQKKDIDLLKALDKYELTRGLEAFEGSFERQHESSDAAIYALLFAHHRRLDKLFDLAFPTVLRHFAADDKMDYLTTLDPVGFMGESDLRDLVDFLTKRKMVLLTAHARASRFVLREISDGFGDYANHPHGRPDWADEEDEEEVEFPPCPYRFLESWDYILRRGDVATGWIRSCASAQTRFELRCRCCSETLLEGVNRISQDLRSSEKADGLDLSRESQMGAQYRAWAAKKRASSA